MGGNQGVHISRGTTPNRRAASMSQECPQAKMVIIGDGNIGKTCLMERFSKGGMERDMSQDYVPTKFRDETIPLVYNEETKEFHHFEDGEDFDDEKFLLGVWDTAGQESMQGLRALAYPHTHCFLIGYNCSDSVTLENVEEIWMKELASETEKFDNEERKYPAPKILVGTKADLKEEANPDHVSYADAYEMAKKIGACALLETSALTKQNCLELQSMVIEASLAYINRKFSFSVEKFSPEAIAKKKAAEL